MVLVARSAIFIITLIISAQTVYAYEAVPTSSSFVDGQFVLEQNPNCGYRPEIVSNGDGLIYTINLMPQRVFPIPTGKKGVVEWGFTNCNKIFGFRGNFAVSNGKQMNQINYLLDASYKTDVEVRFTEGWIHPFLRQESGFQKGHVAFYIELLKENQFWNACKNCFDLLPNK